MLHFMPCDAWMFHYLTHVCQWFWRDCHWIMAFILKGKLRSSRLITVLRNRALLPLISGTFMFIHAPLSWNSKSLFWFIMVNLIVVFPRDLVVWTFCPWKKVCKRFIFKWANVWTFCYHTTRFLLKTGRAWISRCERRKRSTWSSWP